jgi:hypothetical protein
MADERTTLTVDEAISVLPEGKHIHTFRDGGVCLVGADWSRSSIEQAIREAAEVYRTGGTARSMKHGIAINDGSMLFIATDEEALSALEASLSGEEVSR